MDIYLDEVLLENVIVNSSIFYLLSIFTKTKVNKLRIFVAAIMLSLVAVFKTFSISNSIVIQILAVNIVLYFLFKPKKLLIYLKEQLYYYIISVAYIGVIISLTLAFDLPLQMLSVRVILYIVAIFVTYIINKYMWKVWINKIKYGPLTYKMVIKSMDNISFKVFVDTGNGIKDPCSKLDVIILDSDSYIKKRMKMNKNRIPQESKEPIGIPIITAIGKDTIKGFMVKDVSMMKGGIEKANLSKAIIVFMNEKIKGGEFEGILSYDTYMEKLEGVAI